MPDAAKNPLEYARDVVGRDPMASFLGIAVEEVREGYARCSLRVRAEYLNAVNRAHGVTVGAVADQAFAVGSNSLGTSAVGMSLSINYLSAGMEGETLVAEARPVNIGRRVSLWNIEVRGGDGRLIATASGTAYHK
jgi:acyl-CoA thioesterase